MRPHLILTAVTLSLAAEPALAQTAPPTPGDRYGPSTAVEQGPAQTLGLLSWTGKSPALASAAATKSTLAPLSNGLLAHSSAAAVLPAAGAPIAPAATPGLAIPGVAARKVVSGPSAPGMTLGDDAPDGLLGAEPIPPQASASAGSLVGVPPPVRPSASGAL